MTDTVTPLTAREQIALMLSNQHAERMAAIEARTGGPRPEFKVEQVKAVGGAVVNEWSVHVPVCDEYPTAEEAFNATLHYSVKMSAAFPAPSTNGAAA